MVQSVIVFCVLVVEIWGAQRTINEDLRNQYMEYDKCVKHQEKSINEQMSVQSIIVRRGGMVILGCFPWIQPISSASRTNNVDNIEYEFQKYCEIEYSQQETPTVNIHPEDAMELESVWKPSSSYLARKLRKLKDYFKRKVLHLSPPINEADWKYDWQKMVPGGNHWVTVAGNHRKLSLVQKVKRALKMFFNKNKERIGLGDRYELRIHNATRKDAGFYRCIRTRGYQQKMYYVDVESDVNEKVEHFENGTSSSNLVNTTFITEISRKFGELKSEAMISDWSECNRCEGGEQVRRVECVVTPSVRLDSLTPSHSPFRLFSSLPCSSSLVPLDIRQQLRDIPIAHQFRNCYIPCTTEEQKKQDEERVVKKKNSIGQTIIEHLKNNEFIFGEVLPRLKAAVVRRNVDIFEGQSVTLVCRTKPDEITPLFWSSEQFGNLTVKELEEKKGEGRILIDSQFDLVFKKVQLDDDDEYRCFDSSSNLLLVLRLYVKESSRSLEMVKNLEMLTKFAVFLFIFIMVANLVIK